MGGNLWFMGENIDAALLAAERAQAAVAEMPDVITPFPGGIAASGSKAGSIFSTQTRLRASPPSSIRSPSI